MRHFGTNHGEQNTSGGVSPSGEIMQGPDGVYRWAYDVDLFANPTILFTIIKVIGICFGFMWLLEVVPAMFEDCFALSELLETTKIFLLLFAGMMILTVISYWLYARIAFGGKYCVLFEMDEKGITHTQAPKQFKKAQVMALIAGLTANNLSTLGNALVVGSRSSLSSDWDNVRNVQCFHQRSVIKVNEPGKKNQVYASKERKLKNKSEPSMTTWAAQLYSVAVFKTPVRVRTGVTTLDRH